MNQIKGNCTYLKMNLILFLMLLFLILFIPYATAIDNSKIFPNISYGSKIDLTYNMSLIEEYLPLEKKVTVPITIKYYTFINDNIHRYLPDFIANKFLFNSFSAPQQKIKLSIINPPSYGTFSIDPDSVSLNIPIGNEISTKTVDLIITLSKDAPSVPYSLQIACNVSSLGRLNGCSSYIDIPFTPQYTPCITVDGVDSVIVKAKETTNVYVNVTNCGNRASRVYARLLTVSDDLAIFIPQSQASLEVGNSTIIPITIQPQPYKYGEETIYVEFTIESEPVLSNGITDSVQYSLHILYDSDEKETIESMQNPYYTIILIVFIVSCFFIIGKYKRFW